ncbi:DUF5691 domain-containing protein, partial [Streptomyces alkaliterrae]|uniref:DUF5691 domain-containing protein n=1 Tax=Streptomyces alkaliterrae TaxID=2213162 RepID=UPI003F6907F1
PGAGPGTTAEAEPASWEELVTAALLGAERRRPPGGSPRALLDRAAVATVRARAGLRPAAARTRPEPAAPDPRGPLPAAAVARLEHLLSRSGRHGQATGPTSLRLDLGELLPEWLTLARERGYRAPPALIPALLDAARARTDLRTEVLAFIGPRGRWLAERRSEWRFALRTAAHGPGDTPQSAADVRRTWEEGLFAERVALLTAVRGQDPAAGRELLASTWSTERAEDRLMFLDSLRAGLSVADEPFLEAALGDRSRNVRSTAAELLSALPDSRLARRMSLRARGCVSLDRASGQAGRLVVEPPYECDNGMRRDGVSPEPPAGRGARSWWLVQVVESAPLADWAARLGSRSPAELVALPVADDWRADLHASWAWAAVRQRNAEWAAALLGSPAGPVDETPGDPARLLAVLPADARAEWVAGFVGAHGLSDAFRVLGSCAVPWTTGLGQVVVDALEIAREAGSYPWSFSGVLGLAERCLDPAQADRLAPLAARPDEPEDAAPGAAGYWSDAFDRLVCTLRIRAEMRAEMGAEMHAGPPRAERPADAQGADPTPGAGR